MEKPVRILQIVPNMQMGGLENFIMNIYRNIDKENIQFDFLVHYKEPKIFDDEIEKMGGRIYRFSLRNDNNIFKYIWKLNKFYKMNNYKIIHCHMSSIGFVNFIIAKKNGIKIRIAHSHNNSTDNTLKGKLKRIMILPYKYVSTVNFACSESAGNFLYGKKKFEVIPNAIDIKKFAYNVEQRRKYRDMLNFSDDTFVVGHIGRFNIQKNHNFIIEIFEEIVKKVSNAKLVLIGEGELKQEIENLVKSKGLVENVLFLGNRKDVNNFYQAFDCFLFPSLFEGLGITLIEAQIAGLKCYTSKNVVAKETAITENIYYLDLGGEANEWAEKIINEREYIRMDFSKKAYDAGFEIKQLANKLEKKYIMLNNI